jgi:hypothetical protein
VPGDQQLLDQDHGAEQGEAEGGEHDDDRERQVHAQIAGRDLDVIAEAGVAADLFGDGRADGGVDAAPLIPTNSCGRANGNRTYHKVRSTPAPVERQKRPSSSDREVKARMPFR